MVLRLGGWQISARDQKWDLRTTEESSSAEVAVKSSWPPCATNKPLISHPKRHISKLGVRIRKKVWRFGASLR